MRLDDACETMDHDKWNRLESTLDAYNVKPIVAVIPNNEDPKLMVKPSREKFWEKVLAWQTKGWTIALHGYNHVYTTNKPGLIPMNHYSEFAGVDTCTQKTKIINGLAKMRDNGIKPSMWVAPFHTFDENTLKVLKANTHIRLISDGISIKPHRDDYGFVWIPVQNWKPKTKKQGIWTTCLHPNMLDEQDFQEINKFIHQNQKDFENDASSLYQNYIKRNKSIKDILFEKYFFSRRHISFWKNKFLQ